MRIALTDYAPGRELVMDKKLVKCTSLVIEGDTADMWLVRKCSTCGNYKHVDVIGQQVRPLQERMEHWQELQGAEACGACGQAFDGGQAKLLYMIRPDGFSTILTEPLGRARIRQANDPQRFYVKVDHLGDAATQTWAASMALQRAWYRNSQLLVVNEGPVDSEQRAGFTVCFRCWRGDLRGQRGPHHVPTWGGRGHPGLLHEVCLRTELPTDTLVFSFNLAPNLQQLDECRWLAAGFALIEGAVRSYQLVRDHLDCAVTHHEGARRLVLFDNVPGGAAIVRRIADGDMEAWLREAYSVVNNCSGCAPDRCCPRCLQARGNAHMHDKMQRQWAADFIRQVAMSANLRL